MKEGTQDILDALSNKSFSSRTERSQAVYDALTSRAQQSQAKLLRLLSTPSISDKFQFVNVKSFWITNQISIESASGEFINHLASMDEISRIHENVIVHLHHPIEHQVVDDPPAAITANQWGVERVQAPGAWALFNASVPITVANIDSGVRSTHQILRASYKNDGHSWYDAIRGYPTPNDDNGHGTHTMGSIVGSDGYGVAPGALWIACKGLDSTGAGYADTLFACGQFVICPTLPNGQNPDCSRTANIVSNSWGLNQGDNTYFSGMIAVWHLAGVIPIFSMGNIGTRCRSVTSPGDDNVIGVGATTDTDELASFSSVGPHSNGAIKPEISAPGYSIVSASHRSDTTYATMSGTSMACPHVAGAVALLLNRNQELTYEEIKSYLTQTADRNLKSSGATCGGIIDSTFPNNHFGYGRLNVLSALRASLGI
jgi:subtilisin family serine protease